MISIGTEQAPDAEANQKRDKRSGERADRGRRAVSSRGASGEETLGENAGGNLRPEGPSQSTLLGGSLSATIDSLAWVRGRPRWTSERA
jgi:hypothetical protein